MSFNERGLDFAVNFTSTTPAVDVDFDCRVKQLGGFSAGTEIDADTDNSLLLTKSFTMGKPMLHDIQVTTQAQPSIMDDLLSVSVANATGTLTIASKITGGEGQTIANVYVKSCEMDTVDNDAYPTMTITFKPKGGVTGNSPATVAGS